MTTHGQMTLVGRSSWQPCSKRRGETTLREQAARTARIVGKVAGAVTARPAAPGQYLRSVGSVPGVPRR
jgi:hypothetical protein